MRLSYRSIAFAFALTASAAMAQDAAPNPAQRSQGATTGDVFNFGSTPIRNQFDGSSPFSNPAIVNNMARGTRTGTTHITPVPEPSQWAMMLAGLALVGLIVRRNSKRKKDD